MSLVVRGMPGLSSHWVICSASETVTHSGCTSEAWKPTAMMESLPMVGMMNLHSVRICLSLSQSLSISLLPGVH